MTYTNIIKSTYQPPLLPKQSTYICLHFSMKEDILREKRHQPRTKPRSTGWRHEPLKLLMYSKKDLIDA